MARKKVPSKKQIRDLLLESVFDPREEGTPFAVVVSFNDPDYAEMKAMELLSEARQEMIQCYTGTYDYHEKVAQAITLLTLARAQRESA